MAQTTMTFRVDDSLKKDFDKLCDEFGLTNTAALTIFMKTMVRERRIPFEIKTLSEDDRRKEQWKCHRYQCPGFSSILILRKFKPVNHH